MLLCARELGWCPTLLHQPVQYVTRACGSKGRRAARLSFLVMCGAPALLVMCGALAFLVMCGAVALRACVASSPPSLLRLFADAREKTPDSID